MYYRQPRYFEDFHCIGTACQDNCCYGWNISWKPEEVDKLKSAENCSPELRELIEKSFIPNKALKGKYQIAFNKQNRCPFLTEDGLCRIQRELGVEYMSITCMTYPRRYFSAGETIYRACNSSCREVMRHLMNDEKSMDLVNVPIKRVKKLDAVIMDSPEKLAAHPEYKFHTELFEFFYEIISDKKHDVETNIILGALAAQALTKLVDTGDIEKIPDTLKQLKAQMHNGAQLKTIENIKPNYHLRFGFIDKLLRDTVGNSMVHMLNDPSGTPSVMLYNTGSNHLKEIYKDRPFYLRNIALNLLYELDVPLKFKDKTIFENYSLFAAAYACLKLNMIALAVDDKDNINVDLSGKVVYYDSKDKYIGLSSVLCRGLCQNTEIQQAIIRFLAEHKFTSPAYLALLVK